MEKIENENINFYNYKAINSLIYNIDDYLDKYIVKNIKINVYEINNTCKYPYIKYLLFKKPTTDTLVFPELAIDTQEVSEWSGKGMHTTTFAQMYDLPNGGSVIDTPGMRELGLVNLEKEELAQYFPEMREKMSGCQFNNCQHINEPGCAVKAAVEKGLITEARFFSYVDLWHGIETYKY